MIVMLGVNNILRMVTCPTANTLAAVIFYEHTQSNNYIYTHTYCHCFWT